MAIRIVMKYLWPLIVDWVLFFYVGFNFLLSCMKEQGATVVTLAWAWALASQLKFYVTGFYVMEVAVRQAILYADRS